MATVARRASPASSKPTRSGRTEKPVSSGIRGAAGLAKMREEETAQKARRETAQMNANMPFRFFCEAGGATKEIVIIDYTIDEVFWRFEHNLKDRRSGKWNIFTACLNENANCPVCKVAERPSYYAMYLTVIDLTPYVTNEGVDVPWSKKLLVVKSAQQKKITRLAERQDGNLRGMILRMTRDGDKDASIGNDIEFVEFMDEDELLTYETDYEYKRDGKTEVKHIIGHEPFDYDELFPMPTEQQLRAIVGGSPEPGSREDNAPSRRSARSGDDWEDEKPASSRRPASRGRVIDPDDVPDRGRDPDDEEEEEAPPPRRASRAAAPAPASRGKVKVTPPARRSAKAAPVEDEEEEEVEEEEVEDEEEEAPPPRRAAPASRAAPAKPSQRAAPPRRAARPDPEEEEEVEEAAPVRRNASQSLAERRRALRR